MDQPTTVDIEAEIAQLLTDMTSIQSSLLEVLRAKREAVKSNDTATYRELLDEESRIYELLGNVNERRSEILSAANLQGLKGETLKEVSLRLPETRQSGLTRKIGETDKMTQTLRLEQLTNWVVDQQCLLYVSHLLEMIATGGRLRPTYGRSEFGMRGSLLDHEA
ncbi:MAG: hypothetical protein R3B96_23935 [Pirellulaceae bacterium]|nr:flagellar export chaperone FlgN [Planctomycetales bacterium]